MSRIAEFRRLHESGTFVIPNPWDRGSAIFLASLGFKALASTSAGFAWSIGKPDTGVTVEDLLWLVPRRWLDARELLGLDEVLGEASEGERVGARAVVKTSRMVRARGRSWGEVRFASAMDRPAVLTTRAIPKSATTAWPLSSMKFSGLMSRCTTPWLCA